MSRDEILLHRKNKFLSIGRKKGFVSKIDSDENFLPKESILCNWCYFWEECSAKTGTNPYI